MSRPDRECQLDGCGAIHFCKGWCRRHYEQARRGKNPALDTSHYTDRVGTCAAPDCDNTFRQRSAGSIRLYCSKRCRNRIDKATRRASGWVPAHQRKTQPRCSIAGCEMSRFAWGMCVMHYNRAKLHGDPGEAAPRRAARGSAEWRPNRDGYMRRSFNGEIQLQHRYVMEQHIGRPLWPDESVHHKNGDRSDNRLENLELWSSSQPAGQRVEDKIEWAREILARYDT